AIVPESLKFAYVDNSSLDIYNEKKFSSRYNRSHDMDVYGTQPTSSDDTESTKQVLILEFTDVRSIYSRNAIKQDVQLSRAPTLSRSDTLKLIERRNDRFKVAVNELLQATKETGDDPVQLVISAAHHHLPSKPLLNPSVKNSLVQQSLPTQRPSIEQVLEEFRYQDWYKDQSIFHKTIPARQALYSDWDLVIPEPIRRGLRSTLYVESLFAHQAQAIQSLNEGNNVIVSTSTASGKSLIYTLPFLMSFYQDRESTAFFIFPTKALAQDQNTKLKDLLRSIEGMENVIVDTFDGDTPTDRRDDLRDNASLLFTNFDTLHHTILPKEDKWRRYLANLRFVVVDELHYYSGVQGTHVAFVMRRLRRLCAALGNVNIKFISTSATIGNPVRHFQTLFGVEKVTLVDVDGAPSGQKEFLIWKPALIDELMPNGPRNNPMHEVSQLMRYLISRGVRTIAFCKHRKSCEMLMKHIRHELIAEGRMDLVSRIVSYRGGYNQDERRRIEKDLFSGYLLGAVATNALELGIDVGALDAVLCHGFPYSLSSLRQQMGRAGRARRDSLAILIAESLPLDNYYSNYPEEIFTRPPTDLQVDIDNDAIFEPHLQCASDELPVSLVGDRVYFGKDQLERVAARSLDRDDQGWYHCDPRLRPYPSRFIKLRGNEESIYKVYNVYKNSESLIEQVEESRAVFELYEGGIFFNAGLSYQIYEVSHDTKICRANQVNVNFNTKPRDYTDVDPIETCRMRAIKGSTMRAFYGRIKVSTYVFGYLKLRDFKVLDIVDLDTPPYVRLTNGFWLDVPANAMHIMNIKSINPAEAIQAAQHALMSLTPLYTMSAEGDIQTDEKKSVKEYQQKESKRKRPGSCVQGEVKDGQASTSKLGAIVVLSSLIGKQLSMDDIPDQAPFIQSQSVIYPKTIVQADTLSSVELEE
ncbi:P-loop containing nucleoside triphosphate hydrolase protein, partial [Wallemia mellicola]